MGFLTEEYIEKEKEAIALADFVDGEYPYEERIAKMPDLLHVVEELRLIDFKLNPNTDPRRSDLKKFLSAFPGKKTFQTFDDNSDRKSTQLVSIISTDRLTIGEHKKIQAINNIGAGIFLCINETDGRGRKSENITRVRAVFADLDGAPLLPIWDYNPSIVVESSPGKFHAYWLTKDVPLGGFTQLQESISLKFNSDPKVKDLPRVMRVPGFYHQKKYKSLTRIIYFSLKKYSFLELSEMFPPAKKEQWTAPKYQKSKNLNDGEFKGHYGAGAGQRNCHITKRIGGMLKRGLSWNEIEHEAFREGMACSPPLSEKEVSLILKSCRRYA